MLLMVSGQRMWRIHLRQLFRNVWVFLFEVLCVLQVSALYSSTDFMLESDSWTLGVRVSFLDAQMSEEPSFYWVKM